MVAEAASHDLLDSEAFREIANAAPVVLWRIDSTFNYDWVNRQWLEFTGGELEEEVGFAWAEKIHPDDRARVLEEFDRAFEAREPTTVDFRLKGKGGAYRWFRDRAAPFFRDGVFAGFVGSCFDITEMKKIEAENRMLQTELIRLLRAEAMTTLSAAIVHEAKQPLLAITNYAEGLERLVGEGPHLAEPIGEVAGSLKRAAARAAEILKSCCALASGGTVATAVEDLSRVLKSVEPLVRFHPRAAGAIINWELPAALHARVSRTQIEQVMLNLIINAFEATEGLQSRTILVSAARWGAVAVISVADRGRGLQPDARQEVFEPWVSTKEHGIGFGLHIAKLIISDHGGRIWAEDNPGGGSIFRFALPLTDQE
jgi:PAS domain S-box-containing protein